MIIIIKSLNNQNRKKELLLKIKVSFNPMILKN